MVGKILTVGRDAIENHRMGMVLLIFTAAVGADAMFKDLVEDRDSCEPRHL